MARKLGWTMVVFGIITIPIPGALLVDWAILLIGVLLLVRDRKSRRRTARAGATGVRTPPPAPGPSPAPSSQRSDDHPDSVNRPRESSESEHEDRRGSLRIVW